MNDQQVSSRKTRIIRVLRYIEDTILVAILGLMLVLSVIQIVMRNVFDSGIVGSDGLVRILVLWIGMVGAMVAAREGKHINIDVLTRWLPPAGRQIAFFFVELFTAAVCILVSWFSFRFVKMEFEFASRAVFNIPAWIFQSIIPIGFFVIAIRYFARSLGRLGLFRGLNR